MVLRRERARVATGARDTLHVPGEAVCSWPALLNQPGVMAVDAQACPCFTVHTQRACLGCVTNCCCSAAAESALAHAARNSPSVAERPVGAGHWRLSTVRAHHSHRTHCTLHLACSSSGATGAWRRLALWVVARVACRTHCTRTRVTVRPTPTLCMAQCG